MSKLLKIAEYFAKKYGEEPDFPSMEIGEEAPDTERNPPVFEEEAPETRRDMMWIWMGRTQAEYLTKLLSGMLSELVQGDKKYENVYNILQLINMQLDKG
jgi:hypothetical protein